LEFCSSEHHFVMSKDGVLSGAKLNDIVKQEESIGNHYLDPDVVDLMLLAAEEFIESVVDSSASLSTHRKPQNPSLEAKDLKLHLSKEWKMTIPGFTDLNNPTAKQDFSK